MWVLLIITMDMAEPPQAAIDHITGFESQRLCNMAETHLRAMRMEQMLTMRTICLQMG